MCRDGAEVTSTGRSFHMRAPAIRKARRPIVGSLTAGTSRLSDEEDRSLCQNRMSAIGVNCHRYCEASLWGARMPISLQSDLQNNPFRHLQHLRKANETLSQTCKLSLPMLMLCDAELLGIYFYLQYLISTHGTVFMVCLSSCYTSVHSVDVAGCPVSLSDHIKILGDSHLSLDKHINSICKSAFYHIRSLRHIRSAITDDMAQSVASSLVSSRLDYSNSLLFGTTQKNINRL